MSMTQRELIDYCNGRDGKCSDVCLYNSRECDAFVSKYSTVPCLSNITQPELYSDDVIEVEPNMAPEESDNEIPFGNAPFSELDSIINAYEIHGNHKKVVELLKELRERRKESVIVYCKDCKHKGTKNCVANAWATIFGFGVKDDFYCGLAERRTDAIN